MEDTELNGRVLSGITDQEGFSVENWPSVDEGALSAEDLAQFRRHKRAILLYLAGASYATLYEETGFKARYINHTIRNRCMFPRGIPLAPTNQLSSNLIHFLQSTNQELTMSWRFPCCGVLWGIWTE